MAAFRASLLAGMVRRVYQVPAAGARVAPRWFVPYTSVRTAHDVPRHLMPGPYPKTEEERVAAAKKYNLPLEDYKPYPDDGMGYGDYPMLPEKSQEERNPWYSWDHTDFRRNWGETLHWNFDKYIIPRVDTSPTIVPFSDMVKVIFGFFSLLGFLLLLGHLYPSYAPVAPKQFPYNNLFLEQGGKPSEAPPEVKNYVFK
ncbi:NADH dehydrogenase [ubiquinone] 1 beta subcomplex subunit 8, mitochondrial [Mantella aurantiaca]